MTKEQIHDMIQNAGCLPTPGSMTHILGILDAINERIDEEIHHHYETYHDTEWD